MMLLCGACGGLLEQFSTQIIALAMTIPAIRIAITSFRDRFRR